jgi:xanthosine phosphorylase
MTAAALQEIRRRAPGFTPRLAVVAGSGLGGLADAVVDPVIIPYADLSGFPRPTVSGHAGRLLLGSSAGLPVAVMQGRVHGYEGGGFGAMATAIRTLKAAGAEILFLTCAAGSLRSEVGPGRLVAISDHINLLGFSPLVGPNDDSAGPRFPDMTDAWDPGLRVLLTKAAEDAGVRLTEGVYAAVPGPSFETPAEVRMLGLLGADLVGMSTAPECVLARHCGLKAAGVACVTNFGAGMAGAPALSHEQTLTAAETGGRDLAALIAGFCRRLTQEEDNP